MGIEAKHVAVILAILALVVSGLVVILLVTNVMKPWQTDINALVKEDGELETKINALETKINALETNGIDTIIDKKIEAFKSTVADEDARFFEGRDKALDQRFADKRKTYRVDLRDKDSESFFPVCIQNRVNDIFQEIVYESTGATITSQALPNSDGDFWREPLLRPVTFEVSHSIGHAFIDTDTINNHYLRFEGMAGGKSDAGAYNRIVSLKSQGSDKVSYYIYKDKEKNRVVLYLRGGEAYQITLDGSEISFPFNDNDYPVYTSTTIENTAAPSKFNYFKYNHKNNIVLGTDTNLTNLNENGTYMYSR